MVRFRPERRAEVDAILRRLPNLQARSYRTQVDNRQVAGGSGATDNGAIVLVGGRRGYAIVDGRDVDGRSDEAVIDRGMAHEWGIHVGDTITRRVPRRRARRRDRGLARQRRVPAVVGAARLRLERVDRAARAAPARAALRRQPGADLGQRPQGGRRPPPAGAGDEHRDRGRPLPHPLGRARADRLRRRDRDRAARRVLARRARRGRGHARGAGASADVQRRLQTIGIQRAIGVSRTAVAAEYGIAAALVGLLAAGAIGLGAGALAASGPSTRLLEALNEQPPGAALLPVLGVAARRDRASSSGSRPRGPPGARPAGRPSRCCAAPSSGRAAARRLAVAAGGFGALGARLALARRGRAAATLVVLTRVGRGDPADARPRLARHRAARRPRLGRQALPAHGQPRPERAARGARDPRGRGRRHALRRARRGLVRPRRAGRSSLAFPGDHTRFEDPPLASGRRLRGDREAEIGVGLAQALGIGLGATLAVQLPSRRRGALPRRRDRPRARRGRPRRVRAPAARSSTTTPAAAPQIVIRMRSGADHGGDRRAPARPRLRRVAVGGATTRNGDFLGILATLLRAVAAIDALVCLYALAQSLALTARERRPDARAAARDGGAGRARSARCWPAPGSPSRCRPRCSRLALEHWVLAPFVGGLAAGLRRPQPPGRRAGRRRSSSWASSVSRSPPRRGRARRAVAEPPVAGLREE